MESGHTGDSGMNPCIHGTVVAYTGSWVFSFFFENESYLIPTYISAIELSYLFGGNEYGNK